MERLKVGVAMSGGVDSTSTAIMLKDQYNVSGFFMQLAQPDLDKQIERVTSIAKKLGIPLHIIDLSHQFEKHVLHYFCKSYFSGVTPNPCVVCNREIKFGLFLDAILDTGMDKVATGHYARIVKDDKGQIHLLKGVDQRKDQSYFLSRLSQKQLSKIIFPLGSLTKDETYDYAERNDFDNFRGQESQDVCFLEKTNVAEFLKSRSKKPLIPGSIVSSKGQVLGEHNGIENYTIGQRKGLGISDTSPYYVIRLDSSSHNVIVGKENELYIEDIIVSNLHWVSGKMPPLPQEFMVKIRYTHKSVNAHVAKRKDGRYGIHFSRPQRAVAPGQFAVIYSENEVIGSGEISS